MTKMIGKLVKILTEKEKKTFWILVVLDLIISVADIVFLAALLLIISSFSGNTAPVHKLSFLLPWLNGWSPLFLVAVFFLLFSLKNLSSYLLYRAECRFI